MVVSFASSPLPTREGGISFCPKKLTQRQLFGLISFTNQILTGRLLCAEVLLGVGHKDTEPVRPQEAPPPMSRTEINEKTNLTWKSKYKNKKATMEGAVLKEAQDAQKYRAGQQMQPKKGFLRRSKLEVGHT